MSPRPTSSNHNRRMFCCVSVAMLRSLALGIGCRHSRGFRVARHVRRGAPARVFPELAAKGGHDLVVLGAKARADNPYLPTGSVALAMLEHHVAADIVLVRERELKREKDVTSRVSPFPGSPGRPEAPWCGLGRTRGPGASPAGIDCCVLANNHVLDWGRGGLEDTLSALHEAGIRSAGAGRNEAEASSPAVIAIPRGRLLVYGFAFSSSGVPGAWRARRAGAGVNWLAEPSTRSAEAVRRWIERDRHSGGRLGLTALQASMTHSPSRGYG
jgi:Bacterial capsule synthesis protein PGA_cap